MTGLVEQVLAEKEARGDRWEARFAASIGGLAAAPCRRLSRSPRCVLCSSTPPPSVGGVTLYLNPGAPAPRGCDRRVRRVGESGEAGGGYQERVVAAVDLSRQSREPSCFRRLRFAMREAEVMRDLAMANGVPAEAITLEDRAANTHENVVFSDAILQKHGWKSLLLISSPDDMRRAMGTWRRGAGRHGRADAGATEPVLLAHGRASLRQIDGILRNTSRSRRTAVPRMDLMCASC